MHNPPWEHPDWYDLHDTALSAGAEREPEHYRELVLSLPPVGPEDHVLDAGAGTGKLSALVATGYPDVGRVTLLEPNGRKLQRAQARLAALLSPSRVHGIEAGLGDKPLPALSPAPTVALLGSVLMPIMELRGGTLRDGLSWVGQALAQLREVLAPGGWLYAVETTRLPWHVGGLDDPVRRLGVLELQEAFRLCGLIDIEILYRFRDRVIVRGQRYP